MENNSKIGCSNNKVRIIDPNMFQGQNSSDNISVPNEDLTISVVLKATKKGRSILSSDGKTNTKSNGKPLEVRFIEGSDINGSKVLTTKFTDLTTVLDASYNDETLGITSIDIDFNASMAPMVTINFIDVRGSSIFQNERNISGNNTDNKYAIFFQLPYPLFELEIKGYYGLPVTYCLHMLKFSSKFNSRTGNFEIQCQFIGYTYAMLSDMLIGYLRAIKYTEIGGNIYKTKNAQRVAKGGKEIIGLVELSKKISEINTSFSKVSSESDGAKVIHSIKEGLDYLDAIKNELLNLGTSLDFDQSSGSTKTDYNIIVTKGLTNQQSIVDGYKTNIKLQISKFNSTECGYKFDETKFTDIETKGIDKGYFTGLTRKMFDSDNHDDNFSSILGANNVVKFKKDVSNYLDTNYPTLNVEFSLYNLISLYNELDFAKTEVDKTKKMADEFLSSEMKKSVSNDLNFEPTVRNIVEIFTFAAEVFMETVYTVSVAAAKPDNDTRTNELASKFGVNSLQSSDYKADVLAEKIFYPWPAYNQKDDKTNNFVETYLGTPGVLNNPMNVNELKFIDNLLAAFLNAKKDIDLIENASENKTWFPVNPIDTSLFIKTEPYERMELISQQDVITLMVIRGMTFLGYSNDEKYFIEGEVEFMANAEADAILRGVKNDVLKNSLGSLTLKSITDAKNIINNHENNLLFLKNDKYFYHYIFPIITADEGVLTRLILPVSDSFKGEWRETLDNIITKSKNGTIFLSNYMVYGYEIYDHYERFDDGAKYIQILSEEEYLTNLNLPNTDIPINTESIIQLNSLTEENITDAKTAGFNTFGGPLGIQEFSNMNFGKEELNELPLRFLFFNNNPRGGGLTLTREATQKILKTKFDLSSDLKKDGIIKNRKYSITIDNYTDYNYKILHMDTHSNRKLFNQINSGNVTYPYVEVLVNVEKFGQYEQGYDNDYDSKGFKFSLFGSKFYYLQDTVTISTPNNPKFKSVEYARALLFLNSIPWIGNGFGVDFDKGINGFNPDPIYEIMHLFDIKSGFVHVPKLWCAYVGGILWRMDISDPIIENNKIIGGGSSSTDPICWKYNEDNEFNEFNKPNRDEYFPTLNTSYFSSSLNVYSDISKSDILKNMPIQTQKEFKRMYFEFVNNGAWENLKSKLEIYPGGSSSFISYLNRNKIVSKSEKNENGFYANKLDVLTNKDNYIKITFNEDSLFLELKDHGAGSSAIIDELMKISIIANYNYKMWRNDRFNGERIFVSKKNFELYFNTIINKLKDKTAGSFTEQKKKDEVSLFGSENEILIKFMLYKNCKNIYDKWLGGVKDASKIIYQCGSGRNKTDKAVAKKYGNDEQAPSLIDSFRFISRSFKDIGDKLYINPLPINDYLTNDQNTSLYDAVSSILTSNKFTFEALPTFINFHDQKNVEAIFTPYSNYGEAIDEGTCGPTFICVYAGQPSKHLNFPESDYNNDSFDLNCLNNGVNPNIPDDFKTMETGPDNYIGSTDEKKNDIGGSEDPVVSFVVRLGQQNQNIFGDIEMDQSEFTETDESLQIQDEISQKGSQSNRTIAGQNLFNVYSVRSYTAKVNMMGNAMIQPMMYFQLDNIPMFHGAHMITRVQHSITPNNMKTSFTGVRTRFTETPLMTAYELYMDFVEGIDVSQAGNNKKPLGSYAPIVRTIIENGGLNSNIQAGNIKLVDFDLKGLSNVKIAANVKESKLLEEAVTPLREMLKDWTNYMVENNFKKFKDGAYAYVTSLYRTNTYNSPHGWGIAVDLDMTDKNGGEIKNDNDYADSTKEKTYFNFQTNPALKWLYNHAYKYGFAQPYWANDGIYSDKGRDEHWHWEYHGTAAKCILLNKPIPGYGNNKLSDNPVDIIKKGTIKPFVHNPKGKDGKEAVYTDCEYKNILESDTANGIVLSKQQFVEKFKKYAEKVEKDTGINKVAVLAQAALESGWGKSPSGKNNYLNISSKNGTQVNTHEVINGKLVSTKSGFRDYETIQEGFDDYGRLILKNKVYSKAVEVKTDTYQYIKAIDLSGYASASQIKIKEDGTKYNISKYADGMINIAQYIEKHITNSNDKLA